MDEELKRRLDAMEAKLEATYRSAEKSRKYLLWTGVVTIALFVLPLIASLFIVPWFISTYTASLGDAQGSNAQQNAEMQSLLQGL